MRRPHLRQTAVTRLCWMIDSRAQINWFYLVIELYTFSQHCKTHHCNDDCGDNGNRNVHRHSQLLSFSARKNRHVKRHHFIENETTIKVRCITLRFNGIFILWLLNWSFEYKFIATKNNRRNIFCILQKSKYIIAVSPSYDLKSMLIFTFMHSFEIGAVNASGNVITYYIGSYARAHN